MSKSTRRLGRGLESLVSNLAEPAGALAATPSPDEVVEHQLDMDPRGQTTTATILPVDQLISNPFQPRSNADDENILSLAHSIQQSGMIQPIAVRPAGDHYEIIAGERRWRAAKSLGMTQVPALVRQANDQQMLELALIENIHREDLNAIDRANAYRRFCSAFNLKSDEVAQRVGEDRSTVANYLRLLELQQEIQERVADGTLSMGHARCLLSVADGQRRTQLADSVAQNQLSVRALEEIVRREKARQTPGPPTVPPADRGRSAHVVDLQRRFEEAVKTKVSIHEGRKKGSGRITIEYYSLDEFERIAALLGVELE